MKTTKALTPRALFLLLTAASAWADTPLKDVTPTPDATRNFILNVFEGQVYTP